MLRRSQATASASALMLHLGHGYNIHPTVGMEIAWGETESLEYMAFGLGRATHKTFGDTDSAMSVGQIAIKR
jgi:hypothetical protein